MENKQIEKIKLRLDHSKYKLDSHSAEISVAIEEYRAAWSYYNQLLAERNNLHEYFFKTITLPSIGFSLFALFMKLNEKDKGINLHDIFMAIKPYLLIILTVIVVVGLSIFITYIKQSTNSDRYLKRISSLRKHMFKSYPSIKKALEDGDLDKPKMGSLGKIKHWASMVIAPINGALLGLWLYLFFTTCTDLHSPYRTSVDISILCLVGFVLHRVLFQVVYTTSLGRNLSIFHFVPFLPEEDE